jgi:hypothetical protein
MKNTERQQLEATAAKLGIPKVVEDKPTVDWGLIMFIIFIFSFMFTGLFNTLLIYGSVTLIVTLIVEIKRFKQRKKGRN